MHSSLPQSLASKTSFALALGLTLAACSGGGGDSVSNGTLSGSVLNTPTPVSGVKLTINGPAGTFTTTTSNTGTYRIENVPPGDYDVVFEGEGVFDSEGNPIPDKIGLFLPSLAIGTGENTPFNKPVFLPERAIGTQVETNGTVTGTIAAGTVIANESAGVALVFAELTTVTFQDAQRTSISLNRVSVDQTPVPLPDGGSATSLVAIEPAGATFDVKPRLIFSNDLGLPGGMQNVTVLRLDHGTGQWMESANASVTADGAAIVTNPGQGLEATGWHGPVVVGTCTSDISGRVEDSSGMGLGGILVSTANGASAMTDASGAFTIADVLFPSTSFEVVVTAAPGANAGYQPAESSGTLGFCGEATNVGSLVLEDAMVDTVAPTIVSSNPANGAIDVDDAASIRVTFNEALSPGSLNASTLTLTSAGQQVQGTIGIEVVGGQAIVQFVPSAPLALSATYTLGASTGIMDAAGNALGAQAEFTFTTAASGSGGVPSVTVTPDTPPGIAPGSTLQLSADVTDGSESSVDGAQVVWSSDAPSIAVVDATGRVTALTPGAVNIQASFGSQSDTVLLGVDTPVVSSVSLSVGDGTLVAGSTLTIDAQALDSEQIPVDGFSFVWSSDSPGTATVDAGGNISAIAPSAGPVEITAREPLSGLEATVAIVVVDPESVTEVIVQSGGGSLGEGESELYSAQALGLGGDPIPGVSFSWSTSDAFVATVDNNGLVTATGEGNATIIAMANDSGDQMGEATISVFSETPLVVTVNGGSTGDQPQPGVFVIRHDPTTGEALGEMETDLNGRANFGPIGSTRTSLTLIFEEETNEFPQGDSGPGGFETTELLTLHDIRVGTVPIFRRPQFSFDSFSAVVVYPDGNIQDAIAFSGGYSGGTEYQAENQQGFGGGNEAFIDGIEILETEANETSSYIFTTCDVQSSEILAADFLLDLQFGDFGLTYTAFPVAENVAAVPFISEMAVSANGGSIRRLSHLFNPTHVVSDAALSGSTTVPVMPGADRVSLAFQGQVSSLGARPFIENVYAMLPESVEVNMPELTIEGLGFDIETGMVQAQVSGADAAQMDLCELELNYFSKFGPVNWRFQFNPDLTSFRVLDFGEKSSDIFPVDEEFPISLRYLGLDVVGGFDPLMQALRQYRGSVEHLKMDAAEVVMGTELTTTVLALEIGGQGDGIVVADLGNGAVVVEDGFAATLPLGTTVTITANPDTESNSSLGVFDTPECLPSIGDFGPRSCTFVLEESTLIRVSFDQNPQ